jgi:micrococcal nuclease
MGTRSRTFVLFFAVCFLMSPVTATAAWSGKVVGVSDGDSITVLHDGRQEKIRLWGIDCPEKSQDFGAKAKQATSWLVFGKIVEVEPVDVDRYGRTVALVKVGRTVVNEELMRQGLAWVYVAYCKQAVCEKWKELEIDAWAQKRGLWAEPYPVPPWEFRREHET